MKNALPLYTEPLSLSKDLLLNTNQNFVFSPVTRHSGDRDLQSMQLFY